MDWKSKSVGAAGAAAVYLTTSDTVAPQIGLGLIVVALILGAIHIPRFWRLVLSGLAGGAIAGVLILGPGYRVAMRIVAVMDPLRSPEFTLGGTFFIIVGIGVMFGAANAATGNMLLRAFGVDSPLRAGLVVGLATLAQLVFTSGDISDEFFELGAGAWVNIPLFGVFTVAWGIAAIAVADRIMGSWDRRASKQREKVPA